MTIEKKETADKVISIIAEKLRIEVVVVTPPSTLQDLGADSLDMVDIIMNGYDAQPNYGVMAAVGTNANLTPEEVAAIMNHEKTNWGNNTKKVTPDEIKKIMEFVKLKTPAN